MNITASVTGAQVLCKFGELKGLSSAALSSPVYIPPREETAGCMSDKVCMT